MPGWVVAVLQPPLPLQEFWPLQPLSPVLQPPWPLQSLAPLQSWVAPSRRWALAPATILADGVVKCLLAALAFWAVPARSPLKAATASIPVADPINLVFLVMTSSG